MESLRTCPWPRGSSRTISIVLGLGLGLGLVGHGLGLAGHGHALGIGLVGPVLDSITADEQLYLSHTGAPIRLWMFLVFII